ncbi:hypothetical protein DRQ32_03500 [bacterium]|nr:MAG: hypothetical protein DRQ32_03500 [bacterium]
MIRARTNLATLLCVGTAALSAAVAPGPGAHANGPDDMTRVMHEVDASCDYGAAEVAARLGGFYTNFWPNGVVPYEFVTGSTDSIPVDTANNRGWTRILSDVTFSIPGTGAQLSSPTGFPRTWAMFDIVRCTGSTNNDNLDMKIIGGTLNAGETAWVTVRVVPPVGPTFTAEPPSSNVKFFITRSVSEENQTRFETATTRWEEVADLDLRPKQGADADYIQVSNFNKNSVLSDVGHGSGARTIVMNAWTSRRTITHELGHALGVKHEHQRPDRNSYVSIDTTKSTPRGDNNYLVDNTMTIYPNLTYDYGSIMHYREDTFLITGATPPVITVLDPAAAAIWQTTMGTVDSLSYWDKKTMSFMYPESNWRFLREDTPSGTKNGGFLTPWNNFSTAYSGTPSGGRLIVAHPDDYIVRGVYSKAMTIEAPQGGVTIKAE